MTFNPNTHKFFTFFRRGSEGNIAGCCATRTFNCLPSDIDIKLKYCSEQQLKDEVEYYIEEMRKMGKSLLVCTVNSTQCRSAKVLEEMGFYSTPWIGRSNISSYDTKVKLLSKQVTDEVYDEL